VFRQQCLSERLYRKYYMIPELLLKIQAVKVPGEEGEKTGW
jgi:hypothetical protein